MAGMFRFKAGDKVLMNDREFTIAERLTRAWGPMYELKELPGEFAEHLFKEKPRSAYTAGLFQ